MYIYCTHIYVYVYLLLCLRIIEPLHECHECMYICVHACVYVDMYIYMYVHICMYMYIHIAGVAVFKDFKASA